MHNPCNPDSKREMMSIVWITLVATVHDHFSIYAQDNAKCMKRDLEKACGRDEDKGNMCEGLVRSMTT